MSNNTTKNLYSSEKIDNKEFDKQFKSFKYKFWIFLLFLFAYLFYIYFLWGSIAKVSNLKNSIKEFENKKENVEMQIDKIDNKLKLVKKANNQKDQLVDCINSDRCEDISTELDNKKDFFKAYFLSSEVSDTKSSFDQKLLLKNIYEFLLWANEKINIISFGGLSLENFDKGIYKLPITLNVDFESKESFLNFLEKIENKIDLDMPVYYKIDSVNYDVMNYKKAQTVNVSMSAFFYNFSEK